jgi:O-antigen/teichoic acid export membrane protein
VLLYGERYRAAGPILAVLSLGYYSGVALGLNALTLKVIGKVQYLVLINVLAALAALALNLLLVPRYGAMGAAVSMSGTAILLNVLNQIGLQRASGLSIFDRRHVSVYIMLAVNALALFAIQFLLAGHPSMALALAAISSLFVIAYSSRRLQIGDTFPELRRLPLLRLVIA